MGKVLKHKEQTYFDVQNNVSNCESKFFSTIASLVFNIISVIFAWGIIGKASIGIAHENYNGISPDSLRYHDRNSMLSYFLHTHQLFEKKLYT